jgi:hypothetical protein
LFDRVASAVKSTVDRATGLKPSAPAQQPPRQVAINEEEKEEKADEVFLERLSGIVKDDGKPDLEAVVEDALPAGVVPIPQIAQASPAAPVDEDPTSGAFLDRLNKMLTSGVYREQPSPPASAPAAPPGLGTVAAVPPGLGTVSAVPPGLEALAEVPGSAPITPPAGLIPKADPNAPPNPMGFAQLPGAPTPTPGPRTAPRPAAPAAAPGAPLAPSATEAMAVLDPPAPAAAAGAPGKPAPERGTTQVASLTPDGEGWAVKEVQMAKVAPALPKQNMRVLAPQDYLKGVTLTVGKSVRIGKEPASMPLANGGDRQGCIRKGGPTTIFCIEQVDWPPEMRATFEVSTIMYIGQRAIIRYDDEKATSVYALYNADGFEAVAALMRQRYGAPTETVKRVIAPLAQPRLTNTTMIWRAVDPATNMITNMEVRQFDDARGGFPDIRHGVVLMSQAWVPPIFPMLSQLEMMRIVK